MQYILVVVIFALICGLTYTIKKWPGGAHMTFSQHAAANRQSKIFYSLLFLVTLPFLLWFMSAWLVPQKSLPVAFTYIAALAILLQIVCTWFPEEGGLKTIIHRVLTGISGVALLPLVAIIATASSLSSITRLIAWVVFAVMIILLAVALSHQKGYRWALHIQITYYALFFLVILFVTYQ